MRIKCNRASQISSTCQRIYACMYILMYVHMHIYVVIKWQQKRGRGCFSPLNLMSFHGTWLLGERSYVWDSLPKVNIPSRLQVLTISPTSRIRGRKSVFPSPHSHPRGRYAGGSRSFSSNPHTSLHIRNFSLLLLRRNINNFSRRWKTFNSLCP